MVTIKLDSADEMLPTLREHCPFEQADFTGDCYLDPDENLQCARLRQFQHAHLANQSLPDGVLDQDEVWGLLEAFSAA